MPLLNTTIETRALGESEVQVECRLNSKSTTSTVIIRQEAIALQVKSPEQVCAASQVWLALGQVWLAVNQIEGAIICAKAGLEEVGHDYAPPYIEDDTELKLLLAEKRIEKGHLKDGANMMLRVLENRLLLHSKRHQKALPTLPNSHPDSPTSSPQAAV